VCLRECVFERVCVGESVCLRECVFERVCVWESVCLGECVFEREISHSYGVAMISRLLKNTGFFCRI